MRPFGRELNLQTATGMREIRVRVAAVFGPAQVSRVVQNTISTLAETFPSLKAVLWAALP